jgi:cytochrome c551/c552
MERRTNSPYPSIDRPVMALVGVVLVIGTVLFVWADREKDWRYYQYEFRNMVAEQFGEDKAATVPGGLQQIWVAELERADRCTTCHQATNWKGFEQAEHPWRTHPPEPLKTHPVEQFGCTSCHGGQGWAIETEAAHGQVAHWEEPLLSRSLGESYTLAGDKNALMQMNCNTCHRFDRETAGATAINLAKTLLNDKGCRACHVINGFGGTIGPDLSTAVEDTQSRFGMTVDAFITNPTGTMSVVLSRQIILSPEQKQVAIQKLREAFAEYQKQKAAGAAPAVSH